MSDNLGYDVDGAMFSPGGRIYQVDYAANATLSSGTAIGMVCKDGIVLAVENITVAPLTESGANSRTFTVDQHIGAVVAGSLPDAMNIVNKARKEANEYRTKYDSEAPLSYIKDAVGAYVHANTQHVDSRPFAASLILGAYIPHGSKLCCIEPSGTSLSYSGCAIGKVANEAKLKMEKIEFENLPIMTLVKEAASVIYSVHDDGNFELELSWCGQISNGRHEMVPHGIVKEAEAYARKMKEEEVSDSE